MRSVLLYLASCAFLTVPAVAQDHTIRIPAGSLSEALNLLSEQLDTVIIAESADLSGIQSGQVTGTMTAREALSALLADTDLEFTSKVSGVWVVRRSVEPQPGSPHSARTLARPTPFASFEPIRIYDTVIVTGTRAGSPAIESLSPVDVLDRATLGAPVSDDLTDVIAEILPGFFAQRRPLSDGAVFVRPYSLRNLSADHTLILVDGKRRHRSAMLNAGGSQSPDLAMIPTNAIDRVEVLRDGASAQYGSDAIAGVINIITRRDAMTDGFAQYSQYYEGDGVQKRLGLGAGHRTGTHGVRVNLDYSHAAATSRARQRLDAMAYMEAHPEANLSDPVQKWGQPEREDFRLLANGDTATAFGEMYGLASLSWGQGVSDFNWRSPEAQSAYADSDAFEGWTLRDVYPHGFKPQFGQEERDSAATLGLKGKSEAGLHYDVSAGFGENQIDYFLYDTINASMGPASPFEFDAGGLRQREYNLNADFQTEWNAPGIAEGPVELAFGLERRVEQYTTLAGDLASYEIGPGAADGLTSGSNGFPGYTPLQAKTHDQTNWAAYVDATAPLTASTRAGLAVRLEDFDSFGSQFIGKLALRQDLTDTLAFRVTASTGFKAPTPAQLYSERTSQGVDAETLDIFTAGRFTPTGEVATIISQRPDTDISSLSPETSESLSAGLVWQPIPGLVASLDAYSIDLHDRIFTSDEFILRPEERASLTALGVPGGESITTVFFYQNDFETRTSGVDVAIRYATDLVGGALDLGLTYNTNHTTVLNASFIDNPSRVSRFENLHPRNSMLASLRYQKDRIILTGKLRRFGPWQDYLNEEADQIQTFGSEVFVDASIAFDLTDRTAIRAGVENLFDTYPDEAERQASKGLIYSRNAPYDTDGGLFYIRYDLKL
tara:strand:+ start:2244 stop:4919 length:2676 start_codon:yes stop_codon:yes gene_type:complete